jgi:hypothetical protein
MQRDGGTWTAGVGADATRGNYDRTQVQHNQARMQPGKDGDATCCGADATVDRRACNTNRRACNALNSLNLLFKLLEQLDLNSLNTDEKFSEAEIPSQEEGSVVVVDPAWDLQALFTRNPAVKANTRSHLVQKNASAQAFVSWLLYAASTNGKGITKPALFAASKLSADPQAGAGSIYDRLAALPPKILYGLISDSITGNWANANAVPGAQQDWQSVMANTPREHLQAFKRQLFV